MSCSCVTLDQAAVGRTLGSHVGDLSGFAWELLTWALLPVLGHLPCWSWSWPTGLTSWLEPRPAASVWTWVAVTEVCLSTVSGQLCSPCSGTVAVSHVSKDAACAYLVMRGCWLAPWSCCSLTLKAFLNSLWLRQLWGILWWELINIYFLVFLRHWKLFRDVFFYISQEWVLKYFFHLPKLLEYICVYNPHWQPPISTARPTPSPHSQSLLHKNGLLLKI